MFFKNVQHICCVSWLVTSSLVLPDPSSVNSGKSMWNLFWTHSDYVKPFHTPMPWQRMYQYTAPAGSCCCSYQVRHGAALKNKQVSTVRMCCSQQCALLSWEQEGCCVALQEKALEAGSCRGNLGLLKKVWMGLQKSGPAECNSFTNVLIKSHSQLNQHRVLRCW